MASRLLLSLYWLSAQFFCLHAQASTEPISDSSPPPLLSQLQNHPAWLALLYYEEQANNQWTSEVEDENFFLHQQGRDSPLLEIQALSDLLVNRPRDAWCRFPARSDWLAGMIGIQPPRTLACPSLHRWKKSFSNKMLQIAFVSPYMKSPASMFGHTFLQFSPAENLNSGLLSKTANFTASTLDTSNPVKYIGLGLGGGFFGNFDTDYFYRRLRRYNEDEGRDIWLFSLDFSREEIAIVLNHLWEVKDIRFRYYFAGRNCSYRILGLLAAAKPTTINLKRFQKMALPIDTIKYLEDSQLISKIALMPSSVRKFNDVALTLPEQAKRQIIAIANGDDAADSSAISSNQEMLYYAYIYLSLKIQNGEVNSIYGNERIIKMIGNFSPHYNPPLPLKKNKSSPLESHASHKINVSYGSERDLNFTSFQYRLAGHSLLDPSKGSPEQLSAEYLSASLKMYRDKIIIEDLTIVDIASRPSISQFWKTPSWGLYVGGTRVQTSPTTSTFAAVTEIDYGFTFEWLGHQISFLPSIEIIASDDLENMVLASISAKTSISYQSPAVNYQLTYENFLNNTNELDRKSVFEAAIAFPLTQNESIVIHYLEKNLLQSDPVKETRVGINVYF